MNLFKKLLLFSVIVLFSVVSLASTKDSLAQSVDCKNNTIDNSGDSTYPQDFGTYKLFKLKITNNSNTKCVYTFRGGPVEGWKYGFFKNGQTGPINNTQPLEVAAKGSIFFYVKVTPDEKSLKSPTIQLKIDSANFPGDYEIILYEATDKQVCNARGYECGTVRVGATSLGCGSCPTNQACNTNNKCVQRRDPPTATPTKPKDDNTKCAADLHLKPVSPYPKDNETNRIFSLELKNMSSVTCNFTLEGLLQDSSGWQILFHPFGNEAGTINSSNPLRIAAGKYGQLLVRATPSSAAKNNPKTYHIRIDVNPGGEFEVIEYEIKNPNACGTAAGEQCINSSLRVECTSPDGTLVTGKTCGTNQLCCKWNSPADACDKNSDCSATNPVCKNPNTEGSRCVECTPENTNKCSNNQKCENNKCVAKIKEDEEKECNRSKPTLTTTQNTFTKDKGDSATYEIITHNNDKKCGTTDFKLEAKGPDGWKIEFENGNDNVNMRDVASNGQRPKNLKVTSPKNATAGEKHITVKLAETAGGRSRTDTLTLNYKVKSGTGGGGGSGGGGGDQCKGDNTKPHFECQNKACVKVSSCGQNSGGCTKEGQTCGGGGGGGGGGDGDGDKKCTSNNCTAPKSCVNNTCVTPTKKPDEGDKPCQRKDPGLTVTPESQSADKGEQVQYTVEIENKNSGKCDKNNFELTKDIPGGQNTKWSSGWVDQLNKFELGNGEKGTSILKVTSPNDVTNGKKPIVVKVQSGDGKFTKQVSVTYEVTTGSGKQCSLDEDCPADEYCPLNKCQPGEPCPQISAICKTGCRIDPDNCGTGKVCDESTRTCIDQSGTKLIINALGLHGIGTAGDAVAPGTDGNLNPLRTQRPATIEIENENKELVTSEEITINYNADTGKFSSEAVLDELQNFGSFLAFIRVDGFLRAQFPGITNLTKGGTTTVRDTAMTNGDVNGDNYLTLKDFVIFRSCSIYSKDRGACDEDPNFESLTDFNDDGNIDDIDETLWTREKSVVQGD